MTDPATTRRVHTENQGLSGSQLTRPRCLPLNPGESDLDAMLAGIAPNAPAAVALIPSDPVWAVFRATRPHALDRPTRHQLREDPRLVPLPGRSPQGEQLAIPLCTQVHCGAEPTLAAP